MNLERLTRASVVVAGLLLLVFSSSCAHSAPPQVQDPPQAPAADCDTCLAHTAFCELGTKTYSCPPCTFECRLPNDPSPADPGPVVLFDEPAPTRVWDLGPRHVGEVYPVKIAAENRNCRGKQTFAISIEETPWLRLTGPATLQRIGRGQGKTTEAEVDLRGMRPGLYRGYILIECLTCPPPPKCTISTDRIEVVVLAKPHSK